MTINDAEDTPEHVAVGPDHLSAADAFGRDSGDLFITTYATLDSEVDLTDVDAVDMVAGPGATALVALRGAEWITAGKHVRIAIHRATASERGPALADALATAKLGITDVHQAPDHVVLTLGGANDAATTERLRTALRPTRPALDEPKVRGVRTQTTLEPAEPATTPVPGRNRPRPALLDELERIRRWRTDPRRLAVLALAAIAMTAFLAVLAQFGSTDRPLLVVGLSSLVLLLVGGFLWTVHTVLLLARQLDRQTGRLEKAIGDERKRASDRHQAVLAQLSAMAKKEERLDFIEEYVQALAAHGAASDARLRELVDQRDNDVSR